MNTQKLKELSLIWSRSEVACMPIEQFSDLTGTSQDDARVIFGAANALDDLIESLEAAERERDELRAEQAEHDEQIARMESKFSLAKRALDSKTARCEKAEAKLRRRDAAAGEPDGYIFCHPSGKNFWSVSHDDTAGHNGVKPFYFAAPPAVLPELEQDVKNIIGLLSENEWAEHCTKSELGRKLEGEITRLHDLRLPSALVPHLSNDTLRELAALDAANVKWEVKK